MSSIRRNNDSLGEESDFNRLQPIPTLSFTNKSMKLTRRRRRQTWLSPHIELQSGGHRRRSHMRRPRLLPEFPSEGAFFIFFLSLSGGNSQNLPFQISHFPETVDESVNGVVSVGIRRSVLEGNNTLILAVERTRRKDTSHDFKYYMGGWNISDEHYFYSFWLGWVVGSWLLFWALFISFVLGTAYSINSR
ncbi:homogentisate phytyltransferase [Bertholletia excelsa]